MIWAIVTVLGMLAAFCIGREWDKPNLTKIHPKGYRRW